LVGKDLIQFLFDGLEPATLFPQQR